MSKEKMAMLVRAAVLFVALLNQLLMVFGCSILPLSEQAVSQFVSSALMVGAVVWVWWKDNV